MRPSCGRRRSAMSRCASNLTRELTAAPWAAGTMSPGCSTPSMRKRTCRPSSKGSRWMSEARSSITRPMMALTRRMTGASLARSRRCSTKSPASPASPAPGSSACDSASSCWRRSALSMSEASATLGRTCRPVLRCRALTTKASCGARMATTRSCPSTPRGSTWWDLRNSACRPSISGRTSGNPSPGTNGSRRCSARACAASSSDTRPRLTSTASSGPPISRCAASARSRSRAGSLPAVTSRSP